MGTRGLVGFVVENQVKASYNHYDSYPSGLGEDVKSYIGTLDLADGIPALRKRVAKLKAVKADMSAFETALYAEEEALV